MAEMIITAEKAISPLQLMYVGLSSKMTGQPKFTEISYFLLSCAMGLMNSPSPHVDTDTILEDTAKLAYIQFPK